MSSIETLRDEFQKIYNKLDGKYVGYIQLSNERIRPEHIFKEASKLPKLDAFYTDKNYILEMILYDKSSKKSILVRQHNDKYLNDETTLNGDEPIDTYETVTSDTLKIKMAQKWVPEADEFCESWDVSKLKKVVFAGFEDKCKGEES